MTNIRRVLDDISGSSKYRPLMAEILLSLDHDLRLSDDRENTELAGLIANYAKGSECPKTSLWLYLHGMTGFRILSGKNIGLSGIYQSCNPRGIRFHISPGFPDTPMGKAFIQRMIDCRENVSSHAVLLCSFDFDNSSAENSFITYIAGLMCKSSLRNKDNGIASAVHLQQCFSDGTATEADPIVACMDSNLFSTRVSMYMQAIEHTLEETRTDKISEKMISLAVSQYGKQTGGKMSELIERTQVLYAQNHKGGLLGRLFGSFFR